jgi:quinol monooxygenase YgiN
MSVIMTLQVEGDPAALERFAGENPEAIRGISERAKERGVMAHRFYGSDDGHIMVVDEWPDRESFESFFADERENIEPMMREVASGEPRITFWRKLDTGDEIGWES